MLAKIRALIQLLRKLDKLLDRMDAIDNTLLVNLGPVDRHCYLASGESFSSTHSGKIATVRRIDKILEVYGTDWAGKRIVELGGGMVTLGHSSQMPVLKCFVWRAGWNM